MKSKGIYGRTPSDVEANRSHQFEGITLLNDTRMQPVVEGHAAIFEVILEVDIHGTRPEGVGNSSQDEIVCGHKTNRSPVDQAAHHGFRTDSPVVGVCAMKNLIQ